MCEVFFLLRDHSSTRSILLSASFSVSTHVRPIAFNSFSSILLGLLCFLFPWGTQQRGSTFLESFNIESKFSYPNISWFLNTFGGATDNDKWVPIYFNIIYAALLELNNVLFNYFLFISVLKIIWIFNPHRSFLRSNYFFLISENDAIIRLAIVFYISPMQIHMMNKIALLFVIWIWITKYLNLLNKKLLFLKRIRLVIGYHNLHNWNITLKVGIYF